MFDVRKSKQLGTILFYVLWPLVWFYAPLRVRVRVIILVNNEVLSVKNWFGPDIWQLPGGGMKIGENSIQTARREIEEELGLSVETSRMSMLTSRVHVIKQSGLLLRYQYAVMRIDTKPEIVISREITAYEWRKTIDIDLPHSVRSLLQTYR